MATITCDDLDTAIADHTSRGYRLDMIVPADRPTSALLSLNEDLIRLDRASQPATYDDRFLTNDIGIAGRAGMEYRDLISDRCGGRLIASHIHLTTGGEVPDYVHYHKVDFQMIYCVAGAIKVVYEGQGPPFWLMPGDCVLQPPEIRHRVLEAEAGSEVVELGMPAVHETWVEHEIRLPTNAFDPNRDFSGQRFVRHISADASWGRSEVAGFDLRDIGIGLATNGFADAQVLKCRDSEKSHLFERNGDACLFFYCLEGVMDATIDGRAASLTKGAAFVVQRGSSCRITAETGAVLFVRLNKL